MSKRKGKSLNFLFSFGTVPFLPIVILMEVKSPFRLWNRDFEEEEAAFNGMQNVLNKYWQESILIWKFLCHK